MFEKRSELIKFLAVVETGKIQLTAEKLNTTQPALSRIISKLEGQFKGQLFERIPTGVRVTPFGEHIAEQARHILREIEFAEAEVNGAITGRTGNLRITAGPMWMQSIMPKVIKSFHAKYPGIELQIRTTSYKEGILYLSSGESDLHCGAFGTEEPLPQFLKRERIIDMQVGIVAHDTHPIFQKEKVTYHDLVRFPWLTLDEVIDIAKNNNSWPTSSMSLASTFSFFVAHNITTGEGGMILTNDHKLQNDIRSIREFGRLLDAKKRFSSYAKMKNFDSRYMFMNMGYNLRLNDISSSMGIEQLKKLKKINKVRRENAKYLTKKLSTLTKYIYIPSVNKNEKSAYYGFPFMVKKTSLRNKLAKYLEQNDIETRAIMGGCLPDQPAFINQKHRIYKKLLNSRIVKNSGIFIGIHSALEKKHLDKIAITLKNFFKKYP